MLAAAGPACGESGSGAATFTPSRPPSPTATTAPEETATLAPEPTEALPPPAAAALRDLAARLGVPEESIDVVEVEGVVWPDTCLGLPAPELCAPGATPGYRVVLRALGQEYRYHTDQGRTFRFAGPGDAPQAP